MASVLFLLLLLLLLLLPAAPAAASSASSPLYPGVSTNWSAAADPAGAIFLDSGSSFIPFYEFWDQDAGFCLGFFSISPNAYTVSLLTFLPHTAMVAPQLLWTANRNNPVAANSTLEFGLDGDLAIYDAADGSKVWSSNTAGINGRWLLFSPDQSMLLLSADANGTSWLWSSWESPTDTMVCFQFLVSGMKLVSGVSPTNLSEGRYSLVVQEDGLVLYDTASPDLSPNWLWTFDGIFNNLDVPLGADLNVINNGSSLLMGFAGFACPGISSFPPNCTPFAEVNLGWAENDWTFLRLESDGSLRTYRFNGQARETWQTTDVLHKFEGCDLPNACTGSYSICSGNKCICPHDDTLSFESINGRDGADGCNPPRPLNGLCNMQDQHFLEMSGIDFFPKTDIQPRNLTLDQCRDQCLKSCSCTIAFFREASSSCFHSLSSLNNLIQVQNASFKAFIKVQNNLGSSRRYNALHTHLQVAILGVSVGLVAAVGVMLTLCCICKQKGLNFAAIKLRKQLDDQFRGSLACAFPKEFTWKELSSATEGFSRRLGSGAFGTVYLGILPDNSKVAVKRLDNSSKKGLKGFGAEVVTLGHLHHVNLVRLRGFCAEKGGQYCLVYEYMPNSSLSRWLFSGAESEPQIGILPWHRRWEIARGVASGLAYLHEECSQPILHLDVKPGNILLDENFVAKISDFGLSRLISSPETPALTTITGTPGYIAPELFTCFTMTPKNDVYSFGMVLLELVSGRKNVDTLSRGDNLVFHPVAFVKMLEGGRVEEVVDPLLQGEFDSNQVQLLLHISFHCIQKVFNFRPSMSEVVQMLEGVLSIPDISNLKLHFMTVPEITASSNSRC